MVAPIPHGPGHLRIEGIGGQWGRFVLQPVDLEIRPGEYLVLLGPSGCGKTTLMDLVCGLRKPGQGRIWCDGRDITHADPAERAIGYVPQDYELFLSRTVRRNLDFAPHMRHEHGPQVQERFEHAVGMLHLEPFLDRRVDTLSGGERQRVALGRALMAAPKILILDEPVSALPPSLRDGVCQELKALQTRLGITTIHVSHNLDEALSLADRLAVMEVGWVVQTGAPDDILHRPADRFVAEFTRCRNLWPVEVRNGKIKVDAASCRVKEAGSLFYHCGSPSVSYPDGRYLLVVRPEHIHLFPAPETPPPGSLAGCVCAAVRGSHTWMIEVELGGIRAYACGQRPWSIGEHVRIEMQSCEPWLLPDTPAEIRLL